MVLSIVTPEAGEKFPAVVGQALSLRFLGYSGEERVAPRVRRQLRHTFS